MPGKPGPTEPPDMNRCSREELENPQWWRSLGLDFVVLYAWGDPIYQPIAGAIRAAGIFLIQNLDTAGIESPYANPSRWMTCLTAMFAGPQPLLKKIRIVVKGLRDLCPALYETRRLAMIDQADLVAAVSPPAAASMKEYATALGFPQIAAKLMVLPHPVPELMTYAGEAKENRVICVGRWMAEDIHQKDPATLLAALRRFLESKPDWRAQIVGRGSVDLASSVTRWPADILDRLEFTNAVGREELRGLYLKSRVLLCPSRFESFHISSAEAVCCGCSVVVADHPLLSSTNWFASAGSGTLAQSRSPRALASCLLSETDAWSDGRRDPHAISAFWSGQLHAAGVARQILAALPGQIR